MREDIHTIVYKRVGNEWKLVTYFDNRPELEHLERYYSSPDYMIKKVKVEIPEVNDEK